MKKDTSWTFEQSKIRYNEAESFILEFIKKPWYKRLNFKKHAIKFIKTRKKYDFGA